MSVSGNPTNLDALSSMRRKKPRVSRKGRKNLTFKDKVELIATIERNLNNLHEHDWHTVSELFNRQAEHDQRPPRSATSVRSAFNKLRNRKKPTGDAHLDDLIDRANKLHAALYRNGKADNSPLGSDDEVDSPPPDVSRGMDDSQSVSYSHTEDDRSLQTQSRQLTRESPVNKRARTSNIIISHNRSGQHTSPDILTAGSGSQYGGAILPGKDYIVGMPEPQHQSTPQRRQGTPGNIFPTAAVRSMSPVQRGNTDTTFSSFSVSTSNNAGSNNEGRSNKPRASEVQLMVHAGPGMSVASTGATDLINQSSASMHQPVFLNDSVVQDNNYELISSLRKDNDTFREECFMLKSKMLESKTELYELKKAHDIDLARKDAIIAERDARIERLVKSLASNNTGNPNTDEAIRNLKEIIEEKNRKFQMIQTELDYLNQSLAFSNQTLDSMKKLHEMELKKLKAASDMRSNGNND